MSQRLDPATALLLITQYGTWFGPPAIWYRGKCIDGRIRAEAVNTRFGSYDNGYQMVQTTATEAHTQGDAIRLLCLAGEYERVRELDLAPAEFQKADELAAYCHCSQEIVAPLCIRKRLITKRMQPHTVAARRRAIEKIAQLLRRAEQGSGYVTSNELREALKQWL